MRLHFLKPRGHPCRCPATVKQGVDVFLEGRIVHGRLQCVARDSLQNNPRIVGKIPQYWIQPMPHWDHYSMLSVGLAPAQSANRNHRHAR
jgi:hypothetical protein